MRVIIVIPNEMSLKALKQGLENLISMEGLEFQSDFSSTVDAVAERGALPEAVITTVQSPVGTIIHNLKIRPGWSQASAEEAELPVIHTVILSQIVAKTLNIIKELQNSN